MDADGQPVVEDFSSLPLLERWQHTKWNARQSAYREIITEFSQSASDKDPCFTPFTERPDLLKAAASDSNQAALESGLMAVASFAQYASIEVCSTVRSTVLPPVLEKGLVATKPSARKAAVEAIVQFVAASQDPSLAINEISEVLANVKLPKVITGIVGALNEIYTQFGAKAVAPQPTLKALPKLFAHTDRNVRGEASKLAVTLFKWLGQAVIINAVGEIKPVQLKDLEAAFEKAKNDSPPHQEKLLRTQLAAESNSSSKDGAGGENVGQNDVSMQSAEPVDTWDFAEPKKALAAIPPNFEALVTSNKWQERKEGLDKLVAAVDSPRLESEDFGPVVQLLQVVISRDANVNCATQAIIALRMMAQALRKDFVKYASTIAMPVATRYKEKKPALHEDINTLLLTICTYWEFEELLAQLEPAFTHKTPQIKLGTTHFLTLQLCALKQPPKLPVTASLATLGSKLLSDSQATVRNEAATMMGALLKVAGERPMQKALNALDDLRRGKVVEASEKVQVTVVQNSAAQAKAAPEGKAPTMAAPPSLPAEPVAVGPTASASGTAAKAGSPTRSPTRRSQPPQFTQSLANSTPNPRRTAPVLPSLPQSSEGLAFSDTPKKFGARGANMAEFTPARSQPVPARRRYESPARGMAQVVDISPIAETRIRPPAAASTPIVSFNPPNRAMPQLPADAEYDVLRRERKILQQERDALKQQLVHERALRAETEAAYKKLKAEFEVVQTSLAKQRRAAHAATAASLEGVSRQMDGINLGQDELNARRSPGVRSLSGGQGPGLRPLSLSLPNDGKQPTERHRSSRILPLGTPAQVQTSGSSYDGKTPPAVAAARARVTAIVDAFKTETQADTANGHSASPPINTERYVPSSNYAASSTSTHGAGTASESESSRTRSMAEALNQRIARVRAMREKAAAAAAAATAANEPL